MRKTLRIKILLVDDKENNLLSLESLLWKDGYDIVRASSGTEALKILLHDLDFTLILMDVEMPVIDGFETAQMIYQRDKLRHIPIIFVTAHGHNDEKLFRGYKAGAVDYIYKPIQPNVLRAKVSVFVELYQKNHMLLAQEKKLIDINRSLEIEIKDRIASEQKIQELNKQLLDNISMLESTNKELDRFAYMASHDLQEPLRKIRIFSERIKDTCAASLSSDGVLYLGKLESACLRMQNLIDDILAFSKISVNRESLVQSNLKFLAEEVINDMDQQIREKRGSIQVSELPELSVQPVLMKSLFENLINNSLKYAKKDQPAEIRISARLDEEIAPPAKRFWRIYFEDNGIGFDQQYADQIFTMFKRLHSGPEYKGTGIGLAMCKKIVEEHQGFITARSAINAGTTFTISLPVQQVASVQTSDPYLSSEVRL
jgi:signal transduction histidine kinase